MPFFFSLGTNAILQNLGEWTGKWLLTEIITLLLLFVLSHNALLLKYKYILPVKRLFSFNKLKKLINKYIAYCTVLALFFYGFFYTLQLFLSIPL